MNNRHVVELADALNDMEKWLYGDWNKEKYEVYSGLNTIGPVRNYMDYLLDRRVDTEYLARYGMDYTNIHDPRKLRSTESSGRLIRSGYQFVSSNVSRLYRV